MRLSLLLLLCVPSLAAAEPGWYFSPEHGEMRPVGDFETAFNGQDAGGSGSPTENCAPMTVAELKGLWCSGTIQQSDHGTIDVEWVHPNGTCRILEASTGVQLVEGSGDYGDCDGDGVNEVSFGLHSGVGGEAAVFTLLVSLEEAQEAMGNCPNGDQVCECIAETTAELVAIRGILADADLPGIKGLLNQLLELEPQLEEPTTIEQWSAPSHELELPFGGMPVHSVMADLSGENLGIASPEELDRDAYSIDLALNVDGMVSVNESISTDPKDWDHWSSSVETMRLTFRAFMLAFVYFLAFSHIWDQLLKL